MPKLKPEEQACFEAARRVVCGDRGEVQVHEDGTFLVKGAAFKLEPSRDPIDALIVAIAKGRYINASKTLMVENLSVLFAAGDLKFATDLPMRKEIEEDLASFTIQTTAAGNQIITQSRNASGHGDAGVALIVSAFASQYLHRQSITTSTLAGYY